MIARRVEAIRQAAKDGSIIMANLRYFSVHQVRGAYHFSAERLADCLMSQADTEDWNFPGKLSNQCERNASRVRCSGSGRDNNLFRLHCPYLFQSNFIVAMHLYFKAHLA